MGVINNLIYFDNNATTRMDVRVAAAMQAAEGTDAGHLRAQGAMQLASLIGCQPEELFFTSGITPAIHLAIQQSFDALAHKGKHIVSTVIEHGAVLKALEQLKLKGAQVTYLGVNREGLVDAADLEAAIRPDTCLVTIMAANNHTGVIQPLEALSESCRKQDVFFLSDASQFVGKMRCDVGEPGADSLLFGSHKMHGPREIGAMYAKQGTALHEKIRQHQSVVDPVLLAGFAKAAELCAAEHWENSAHVSKLKNYFEHQLLDIEGLRINGSTRHRLYNTSNLTFPPNKAVSNLAGRFKFLSYDQENAHALKAMGIADEDLQNTFRFSFGKYNSLEEVQLLVEAILAL